MDMSSIAAAGLQNQLPQDYSMAVMRKAMGTEKHLAAQEVAMMMPQIPQTTKKGQFVDVYA